MILTVYNDALCPMATLQNHLTVNQYLSLAHLFLQDFNNFSENNWIQTKIEQNTRNWLQTN